LETSQNRKEGGKGLRWERILREKGVKMEKRGKVRRGLK
jgi:hypothetical protein